MKTYVLKINMANIRKDIEKDYFKYKDIFFKCLLTNLYVYSAMYRNILPSTVIEDSHYNQHLMYLVSSNMSVEEAIQDVINTFNIEVFLDTNVYFEEFIQMKHDEAKINVYQLTIDDYSNIVVTNKQIIRHA